VSIWNTRQNEFGKEIPDATSGNGVRNAGTIAGPPGVSATGTSTYLRIVHSFDDANNEHELRSWTKRNEAGAGWVKGGTWTLPGSANVQVGLVSQGWQPGSCCGGDRRTSRFDYFRAYTD